MSALSRLAALAAVALIISSCGTSPSAAAPGAASPVPAVMPRSVLATPARGATAPAAPATPTPGPLAAPGPAPAPTTAPASLPAGQGAPVLRYSIVTSYPHDAQAWTQGLVYIGGDTFYEGTGLYGRSTLREVALDGTVRRSVPLPPQNGQEVFGEGVAVVGDRIFQLTWQNCVGYIYDRATFARVGQFTMPVNSRSLPWFPRCLEGWGLTYDGARLILSDGTDRLFFVDPAATEQSGTLAITGQVLVRDAGSPVPNLNELEYIKGEVYANIWYSTDIVRIDPASGAVTARIDLSGLSERLPETDWGPEPPDVLNGIAYDAQGDRLFVTGKLWPRLFEIDIVGAFTWFVRLPLVATT